MAVSSPTRRAPALDTLVAALSLLYVAMVVAVWVRRAAFPYELEWLEGVALETAQRVRHGQPIYVAPSLSWVPLNYTPLYAGLGALACASFGETFLAMRLVSIFATLVAGACLWMLVRVETERAAPAWLAVGLFAATYRLGGAWFDVARPDSLQLALVLAGAVVARVDRSRWRMPLLAGALFTLGFLAKQSVAPAVAPLVLWLAVTDRPRGGVLLIVFGALVAASVLALDAASGGWFWYYAVTVPGFHHASPSQASVFPLRDVLDHFGPLLLVVVLAWWRARPALGRQRVGFTLALAAGLLAVSWYLRLYNGGYDNVLMPTHAVLALLGACAFAALTDTRTTLTPPAAVAAVLMIAQLALLLWSPAQQVPPAADRVAGNAIVAGLRSLPGRVFVSSHTYLLDRAGRPAHAHVMPLMDVIRDGHGERERALLAALRDSLRAQVWDGAVLDQRDWLIDEFRTAGYRPVGVLFTGPDGFWPVTGMRTRPYYLVASPAAFARDSATALR